MLENVIIIGILAAIVGGSALYLWRAKKRGETCVGCPHSKQCGGPCNGGCSSMTTENKNGRE